MIVTAVIPVTKQKYQIALDEQPAFVLYKGELRRYRIQKDEELSQEIYDEIISEVLTKRARLRTMHLLQSMDRTEQELRIRLKRSGYPHEVIDDAIAYVASYGYLNDREYAHRYIECRKEGKGKQRIMAELLQKGISRQIIQEELEDTDFGDQREQIKLLVEKKRKTQGNMDQKERQRLYGFLSRKGFSQEDIFQVLNCYRIVNGMAE